MGLVSTQSIKYGVWCVEVGKRTPSHKYNRKLQCIFSLVWHTHQILYTYFFSSISFFIRQSHYQGIKISHRETDPANSLQWRERKWTELYQEIKIRPALLLHQVLFIATDFFWLQHSVKEKPQTSHLPWMNKLTSQCKAIQSVQQSLFSSSVCATEWMGRFCQAVYQSFAFITNKGTDRNVAVSIYLHPAFIPEMAVEALSPRCCSVCVCVPARWPRLYQFLPVYWPHFLHFPAEHWALLFSPVFLW